MPAASLTERAVLMLRDLPPYEQDATTVQRVINAVSKEIVRLEDAAALLIDRLFAHNADDELKTLALWEEALLLPVNPPGVAVNERRANVLAVLRAQNAGAGYEWVELISTVLGESVSWSHEDDFDDYTVRLNLPGESGTHQARMTQAFARRVTPAHLELNFNYEGGFVIGESLVGDPL